jgi:hypothetical protein
VNAGNEVARWLAIVPPEPKIVCINGFLEDLDYGIFEFINLNFIVWKQNSCRNA